MRLQALYCLSSSCNGKAPTHWLENVFNPSPSQGVIAGTSGELKGDAGLVALIDQSISSTIPRLHLFLSAI